MISDMPSWGWIIFLCFVMALFLAWVKIKSENNGEMRVLYILQNIYYTLETFIYLGILVILGD